MNARHPFRALPALLIASVLACGCARTIIFLDKPAYHYQTGMKFLNQGNLQGAKTEFEYAVFLDGAYAQAILGLALVQATEGELDKAAQTMRRFLDLKKAAVPPPPASSVGPASPPRQ